MVADPQKELETILYQSRQLVGRLGANESQNEITRMRLMELRDAAKEIYEAVANHSEQLAHKYEITMALYKAAGLL
jgi:hypothetical protein